MKIELEQETDGRWIAEAPELPGVLAYGNTRDEALRKVKASPCASWPTGWSMARRYLK